MVSCRARAGGSAVSGRVFVATAFRPGLGWAQLVDPDARDERAGARDFLGRIEILGRDDVVAGDAVEIPWQFASAAV